MIDKCSVELMYETYPNPLPLGSTRDSRVLVVVKRVLLQEAEDALRGAEVIGDDVLISAFRNDLDTLRKTLDLVIPQGLEESVLAGGVT